MNNNSKNLSEEMQKSEPKVEKQLSKKILVVDDDPQALKRAVEILKGAHYEVLTLDNSKFALKTVKNERPDAVVLDIIMRPIDGYKLCDEIKKAYRDKVPVLLCTAQTYEQDFIKKVHKDFGADDYIIKPVNSEEFLAKVNALIKKKAKN